MIKIIFPAKGHPDDLNPAVATFAKAVFLCGFFCFIWSGFSLMQWVRAYSFESTGGTLVYGNLGFVVSKVRSASFVYMVDGKSYTSQNIVIGGRPLGAIPRSGPVTVYYNPKNPEEAVLYRRPAEVVILAFLFSLCAPFIACFIWKTYA